MTLYMIGVTCLVQAIYNIIIASFLPPQPHSSSLSFLLPAVRKAGDRKLISGLRMRLMAVNIDSTRVARCVATYKSSEIGHSKMNQTGMVLLSQQKLLYYYLLHYQ